LLDNYNKQEIKILSCEYFVKKNSNWLFVSNNYVIIFK
jgi:hypothetical protein